MRRLLRQRLHLAGALLRAETMVGSCAGNHAVGAARSDLASRQINERTPRMLNSIPRWTPGVMLVLTLGAVAVLSGQAVPSPSPAPSAMDQLLTEVRGLRAELNRAAGSSM